MRKRPVGGAARTPRLILLALACLVGQSACWSADLPALATRTLAVSDGAATDDPDPAPTGIEGGAPESVVVTPDGPGDAGDETGTLALSVGLPIDAATGQVATIGSVNVTITARDGTAARALTLELTQPRQRVSVSLTDIPAGGPYRLEVSAAAPTAACATPDLSFSVPLGQTVRVAVALICNGDGGWIVTL
jgi:hypothetical protein